MSPMRKFMLALTALLTPVLLSAPAFASDFDGGQTGGGRLPSATRTLLSAVDDLADIVGQVFSLMAGNPLLVALLAAGLLGVGIRLFRKAKSAAR